MEDQGPGGGTWASLLSRHQLSIKGHCAESMRDGYHPKMLLYALDELFYVSAKIKDSPRDEKVILAYEILCISSNRCTDRRNGVKQMGVPDALALLNIWSAWPGLFTTAHCWWACGPSFWAPSPGASCWQGCSDTSTGATMKRPIVRCRP